MAEAKAYKRGDIIKFKDLREYEVLIVYPSGYLVADVGGIEHEMSEVRFFKASFVKEAQRRNYIIPDRSKK